MSSELLGADGLQPGAAADRRSTGRGTSLAGGRASLGGTIAAAFTLTLIGNVVFSFGLASGWQIALSGALLIVVVLVNGLPAVLERRRGLLTGGAR